MAASAFRILVLASSLVPNLVSAQSAVTNQRLFDTGPFLQEHYDERVERFEAEPIETGRVLFLGDSITEGGDWQELTGDSTVINRGISGDVSFGVLGRLDDVTRRRPSKLFVLIGINDIAKDIPEVVIADNVRRIVDDVRTEDDGTEIFIQSVLPLNPGVPGFPQHYDKENEVVRLNRLLRATAEETGVRFVNLFPLFIDRQERLDESLTEDGLHLNAAGYAIWADYLKANGYL